MLSVQECFVGSTVRQTVYSQPQPLHLLGLDFVMVACMQCFCL